MKKKWWMILVFSIPLVFIICLVSAFWGGSSQENAASFYKVTRDTLIITVVERGNLEPKEVTHGVADVVVGNGRTDGNPCTCRTCSDRHGPGDRIRRDGGVILGGEGNGPLARCLDRSTVFDISLYRVMDVILRGSTGSGAAKADRP